MLLAVASVSSLRKAVQVALRKLENDPDLPDRTEPYTYTNWRPVRISSVINILPMFIYEQQDGAAMDSPVSAVTADLYMEGSGGDILKTSIFTLETRQITFFFDSFHDNTG